MHNNDNYAINDDESVSCLYNNIVKYYIYV